MFALNEMLCFPTGFNALCWNIRYATGGQTLVSSWAAFAFLA